MVNTSYLVGGAITILKNMSSSMSQWEGWHPIYEMENEKMFETTNELSMVVYGFVFTDRSLELYPQARCNTM